MLDEDLLVEQDIGTMPCQEDALTVRAVSGPAIAASTTTTVPLNEGLSVNTTDLEVGLPVSLLSIVHGADGSHVKVPGVEISIGYVNKHTTDLPGGAASLLHVIDVLSSRNSSSTSDGDTSYEDVLLLSLDGVDTADDRESGN